MAVLSRGIAGIVTRSVVTSGVAGLDNAAFDAENRMFELFTVEVDHRWLRAISLTTGESRIEAENLAVGLPPGIVPPRPATAPGPPGPPRQFAGLAVGPDGSLLVSANGEGTVLRLTFPRRDNRSPAEEAWK
ncbi:hypothetical protein ACWD25_40685 [Streptomyces sp. NPDC002920]